MFEDDVYSASDFLLGMQRTNDFFFIENSFCIFIALPTDRAAHYCRMSFVLIFIEESFIVFHTPLVFVSTPIALFSSAFLT